MYCEINNTAQVRHDDFTLCAHRALFQATQGREQSSERNIQVEHPHSQGQFKGQDYHRQRNPLNLRASRALTVEPFSTEYSFLHFIPPSTNYGCQVQYTLHSVLLI